MRTGPARLGIVVLTVLPLLVVTLVPLRHAAGDIDSGAMARQLLERIGLEDAVLERAIAEALDTRPTTAAAFVDALLGQMTDPADPGVRALLSLLVPGASFAQFLNGARIADLRIVIKTDRGVSPRGQARMLTKTMAGQVSSVGAMVSLVARSVAPGPNLLRWQIRELITADPLGP